MNKPLDVVKEINLDDLIAEYTQQHAKHIEKHVDKDKVNFKMETWLSDKKNWLLYILPGSFFFFIVYQHLSVTSYGTTLASQLDEIPTSKLFFLLMTYYCIVFAGSLERILIGLNQVFKSLCIFLQEI